MKKFYFVLLKFHIGHKQVSKEAEWKENIHLTHMSRICQLMPLELIKGNFCYSSKL